MFGRVNRLRSEYLFVLSRKTLYPKVREDPVETVSESDGMEVFQLIA